MSMQGERSRYSLIKQIGYGSFGEIWLVLDAQTGQRFAMKLEKPGCEHPQLLHEAKVMGRLQGPGFPQLVDVGEDEAGQFLVMTLLGPSLEDLLMSQGGRLSLKTVLMLGEQVLCRLHYMHSKHYVHRDIKPDNLLIGVDTQQTLLHLVDFGLAKKYRDPETGEHIGYSDGLGLAGTSRYTSINTHVGIEQSRRDDIEGLGYVLVYLLRGSLPWQGLVVKTKKERYQRIMESKLSLSPAELCKGLPDQLKTLVEYARALAFEQAPDYSYLRRLLKELLTERGLAYDYRFDWAETEAYKHLVAWKTLQEIQQAKPSSRCALS